jgi:plastocyanin
MDKLPKLPKLDQRAKLFIAGYSVISIVVIAGLLAFSQSPKKPDTHDNADKTTAAHADTPPDTHAEHIAAITAPQEDLTSMPAVSLDITRTGYSKPNIKIKKGTTVTWTNQDTVENSAMREHAHDGESHTAPTAAQVSPDIFNGPLLAKGESYSFTFNEVDTTEYHSASHPEVRGLIAIVE